MIRRLTLLLLALVSTFQVTAAITLDDLQQRSAKNPVIRVEFQQTRQISGLSQPLVSSGNLIISIKDGLWWNQKKPFSLTLLLTENRMVQTMTGQPAQVITVQSNPQMFQFNHLLTALFHADRAVLEKNFNLDLQDVGQNRWILILKPKTTPLDKLFRQITLTGADLLETIEIDDMQNDKSSIRFFNHQIRPERLTDEESKRFNP